MISMSSKEADDYLIFEFNKTYRLWTKESISWPTDNQKTTVEYFQLLQDFYDHMNPQGKLLIRELYPNLPSNFKQDDNILMAAL